MSTFAILKKTRFTHHGSHHPKIFVRSPNSREKRQKETILFLLHQERMFDCQNNREMITNSQLAKERKVSAERLKVHSSIKQTLNEKPLTLTPKFKKHNLSESKLPPLKKRAKRQIELQIETITPWQQEVSNNLMRPHSSKVLPY